MKIHEAVKKALEEDALIIRTSAREPESDIYAAIKPTNSYDTCRLIVMEGGKAKRECRCWNPTADAMMADDWNVIEEVGTGKERTGSMKMNKEKFLRTEMGGEIIATIKLWDRALEEKKKYVEGTDKYYQEEEKAIRYAAKWEAFQIALHQFYGGWWHFTRTDEYFGVTTDDGKDWLYKEERR